MPDATSSRPELSVADALGRMPLESPIRSAWPALAAQLPAARPRRRRWPMAMLAAAALAALAVLPGRLATPVPDEAPMQASANLAAVMGESAQLEALLGAVSGSDMANASATLLLLEFEDQLQQIDATLADAELSVEQRQTLWRMRVAVLRQYASVQGMHQWLAANGDQLDGTLVAVY